MAAVGAAGADDLRIARGFAGRRMASSSLLRSDLAACVCLRNRVAALNAEHSQLRRPTRKKARFLRRGRPAKRCIALRVAAEALDDGAMFARITLVAAAALDQQMMVSQSLAVQQRHVEKIKPGAGERTIEIFAEPRA
jgi:hypothetical protein